jgi:hypothetical protein
LFHAHAHHRKRKNFICKLKTDDGTVLTKHEEKEEIIFDFYINLLGKSIDREVTVNQSELDMPNIVLTQSEATFLEEEVWKIINSLPFAKLITKILANRLAATLNQLVSPNQSAFIKGRYILDNFMLVHHTTKFLHQ